MTDTVLSGSLKMKKFEVTRLSIIKKKYAIDIDRRRGFSKTITLKKTKIKLSNVQLNLHQYIYIYIIYISMIIYISSKKFSIVNKTGHT